VNDKTEKIIAVPCPASRTGLLAILAAMPEEAFSWLVVRVAGDAGVGQIWPDGLGGFRPDSRASIEAAQAEARAWQPQEGR
jgi:hypothetical protein